MTHGGIYVSVCLSGHCTGWALPSPLTSIPRERQRENTFGNWITLTTCKYGRGPKQFKNLRGFLRNSIPYFTQKLFGGVTWSCVGASAQGAHADTPNSSKPFRRHKVHIFRRAAAECVLLLLRLGRLGASELYRDRLKGMQILLGRSQAGAGRTGKQEQEQTSRNHVQAF